MLPAVTSSLARGGYTELFRRAYASGDFGPLTVELDTSMEQPWRYKSILPERRQKGTGADKKSSPWPYGVIDFVAVLMQGAQQSKRSRPCKNMRQS